MSPLLLLILCWRLLSPSAFNLIRWLQSSPYLYTVFAAASLSQINALGYIKSRACVLPARRAPRQITAARAGGAPLRDTHSANPFHLRATNRVQYSAYRLGKA